MKKLLIITFSFFLCESSFCQNQQDEGDEILNYINTLKEPEVNGKKLLLNKPSINKYFNENISNLLTGKTDLTLYKNYFIVDPEDDVLFIGRNITNGSELDYIKNIWTPGFELNYDDGFSNLINDTDLVNDVGLSLKYTRLWSGFFNYDQNEYQNQKIKREKDVHRKRLNKVREKAAILTTTIYKIEKENFQKKYDSLKKNGYSSDDLKKLEMKFLKDMKAMVTNEFVSQELKSIAEGNFNYAFKLWLNIYGYIPITVNKFSISQDFTSSAEEFLIYPWEINVSLNALLDRSSDFFLFGFFKTKIFRSNSILTEEVKKYTFAEYRALGGTDTLSLATLSTDEKFVGEYSEHIAFSYAGQLALMWDLSDPLDVGLSVEVEKVINNEIKPINITIGIPFSLSGKEDDAPLNVQPLIKFQDINHEIKEDKIIDKAVVGIKVGVPFGNTLY